MVPYILSGLHLQAQLATHKNFHTQKKNVIHEFKDNLFPLFKRTSPLWAHIVVKPQ